MVLVHTDHNTRVAMGRSIQLLLFFIFLLDGSLFAANRFLNPLGKDRGPVDIVYTWVNGSDPAWQRMRDKVVEEYKAPTTCEAKVKSRFRSRDELKYSMRSILRYAPFVNHIYIVTAGQTPSWLKPHPKVSVINHRTIFSDHFHLPTFNSHAIEANLHKIPGLSERFIYFNDDVFLNRKVKERHFYSKRGKIKIYTTGTPSKRGVYTRADIGFFAGWKNNNQFLDNLFGKKKRFYLEHAPFALRKSHIRALEKVFPEIIQRNSSHKFRSPEDFAMLNGLIQYFAAHQGQARKARFQSPMMSIGTNLKRNRRLFNALTKGKSHAFCLQDVSNFDNPWVDQQLCRYLEERFPEKAPWEQ